MDEKPIERLNYYNGLQLAAADLKLEQEYHMRVRRWLNKSLYSAGIAHGLEVKPAADASGKTTRVVISPGLALDAEGREIILLEEIYVDVVGKSSKEVEGNYLTVQYHEETRAEESDGCTPGGNGRGQGRLAWGGPSRIRATPLLGWSDVFPHASSGKIVLAQVELDQDCTVRQVYTYPRRYIGPASAATVRQYALEGERHIDANNPGRIYFHVRGRQPNAVTLYLRAERFSTLYYTEMGQHNHPINVGLNSFTVPAHQHTLPQAITGGGSSHDHSVDGVVADTDEGLWKEVLGIMQPNLAAVARLALHEAEQGGVRALSVSLRPSRSFTQDNLVSRANMSIDIGSEAEHTHSIPGATNYHPENLGDTTYPLSVSSADSLNAGVKDPSPPPPELQAYSGRTGQDPLTYVFDLQVYIGRADSTGVVQLSPDDNYTAEIRTQLQDLHSTMDWAAMGDGTAAHALAQNGAGPIRLDLLSPKLSFPEGAYYIELRVAGGGGRILYNLYVE